MTKTYKHEMMPKQVRHFYAFASKGFALLAKTKGKTVSARSLATKQSH